MADEATGPTLVQSFSGALLGSVVNVFLHFLGPQKTREMLHTAFACVDRHAETPCKGDCTVNADLDAIFRTHLAALVPARVLADMIDALICIVIMTELDAGAADHMITTVFHMHGVDAAQVPHAVA